MGSLTCFIVVSALLLSIVAKSAAFNFNFNFGGNSKIQSSVIQSTGMIPGETIAVVGASGNVGKLVALRLSETYNVHGIVREPSSVAPFFAGRDSKRIKLFQCDLLQEMKTSAASAEPQLACSDSLLEALESANGIVICTGTTAYPTKAWAKSDESSIAGDVLKALIDSKFSIKDAVSCLDELGLNTPNNVDARANEFILKVWDSVCSVQQKRAIMLSSIGVQRRDTMPFPILNIFGVLDAKAAGEESLKSSAAAGRYSWTIIRPGQLFGGRKSHSHIDIFWKYFPFDALLI